MWRRRRCLRFSPGPKKEVSQQRWSCGAQDLPLHHQGQSKTPTIRCCTFLYQWKWTNVKLQSPGVERWSRVWRICSNVRIFKYFWSEYVFGYLFVSFSGYKYIRIFVRVNFFDTNIFRFSFVAKFWYKYIRIFVRINFQDTNRCSCLISLDITLCLCIFCW